MNSSTESSRVRAWTTDGAERPFACVDEESDELLARITAAGVAAIKERWPCAEVTA